MSEIFIPWEATEREQTIANKLSELFPNLTEEEIINLTIEIYYEEQKEEMNETKRKSL